MAVSGTAVFQELKQNLKEVREEAARFHEEAKQIDAKLSDLVAKRGQTLMELARHYLPTMSKESVEGTFTGVRDDLQTILERKERSRQELEGRLQRLQQSRTEIEGRVKEVTASLNAKVAERDRLQQEVGQRLAADEAFQTSSKLALAAELELKRNEARVEEIQREAKEKLPAYQRSRIFQYLQSCKFGTEEYTPRGLMRDLDRWVAKLVNYELASRSFNFLNVTPGLMADELAHRQQEFHKQMDQVEQMQSQAAESVGLNKVLAEGKQFGATRDQTAKELDESLARCREVQSSLTALEAEHSPFYDEALGRFSNFLDKTEIGVLETQAQRTPDRTDDEIVSRVKWLTDEINRIRPQISQQGEECKAADNRAEGCEFVVRRFQQSNFDSDRSEFSSNFNVSQLMKQFRLGAMDRDACLQSLKESQKFQPTWAEQSASDAGKLLTSPTSQMVLQAMVQVAGTALQAAAQRSVIRRQNAFPSWPSSPAASPHQETPSSHSHRIETPASQWVPANPPQQQAHSRPGGFTTEEGF